MNIKDKVFTCLNCEADILFKSYSNAHKYCNNGCAVEHREKQRLIKDLPLFNEGKIKYRGRLKTLLTETQGYKCACCGISEWQGKEIVLQVDHINGDATNDMPNNLRLLCPNCHTQTDTFAGKNKGNGRWTRDNLSKYH